MRYTLKYNNMGGTLKKALAKRGRTQVWLADKLGVHKSHVSKWCRNVIQPTSRYVHRIAKALDFEEKELITGVFNDEVTYNKIPIAGEPDTVYSEEVSLFEAYLDQIISSKNEQEKQHLKRKVISLLTAILS